MFPHLPTRGEWYIYTYTKHGQLLSGAPYNGSVIAWHISRISVTWGLEQLLTELVYLKGLELFSTTPGRAKREEMYGCLHCSGKLSGPSIIYI